MKRHGFIALVAAILGLGFFPAAGCERRITAENPIAVRPIGTVERADGKTTIVLEKRYAPGLLGLDGFSHIHVLYWFDQNDTAEKRSILQVHPRGDRNNPLSGVFATRSPTRPNLIALSLCNLVEVRGNMVEIDRIDAFDGTPVLDIKPYIHGTDAAEARHPEWLTREGGP